MRFLISILLPLLTACAVTPAFAASNAGEYSAMFSFNHGSGWDKHVAGQKIIGEQVRSLRVQYDFAKQGGAVGTIILPIPKSPGFVGAPFGFLPKNSVIVGCYIDVLTAGTTSAGGTIAISTGQAGADLKAATAAASYTGILACIPTGTAASAIKITADAKPSIAIATGAITAGKFNLIIEYVLSDP